MCAPGGDSALWLVLALELRRAAATRVRSCRMPRPSRTRSATFLNQHFQRPRHNGGTHKPQAQPRRGGSKLLTKRNPQGKSDLKSVACRPSLASVIRGKLKFGPRLSRESCDVPLHSSRPIPASHAHHKGHAALPSSNRREPTVPYAQPTRPKLPYSSCSFPPNVATACT